MARLLLRSAGFVAAGMLLFAVWVWATAPALPDTGPWLEAPAKHDVRIVRDAYGVPHVYGDKDTDVVFGLAYAHAEDDFATIQDVLLAGRGKLATVYGAQAAPTDYIIHFMGVWDAVDAGYEQLPAATRAIAEAYADGYNLYAARLAEREEGAVSPFAFPATGKDIVAGFTFKTPLFYGLDQMLAKLADGSLTGLNLEGGAPVPTSEPQADRGSQAVAIAPHRSDDGATRLLVNSHQPLTGPVAWYEARLKSGEGIDLVGATFPGSPLILHGAGPAIGWASTVNKPDLADVYRLTINPDNEDQYLVDGEWRDMIVTNAPLRVKLWGQFHWTVNEPVRNTIFGPVLTFPHGAYAINFAGRGEIRGLEFFRRLNKAKNRTDFEAALAMRAMPSINYVYGDASGEIAYYYNAMMPDRHAGDGVDWQGVLDGSRSDLAWSGYVAATDLPRVVNPPSGEVFNANNTPFLATTGDGNPDPAGFPGWMGIETHQTNRAHRLDRLLSADDRISLQELRQIKYDLVYDPAWWGMQRLNAFLRQRDLLRPPYEAARTHLRAWNGSTDLENRQAALGVLVMAQFIASGFDGKNPPPTHDVFTKAVDLLIEHYGTVDIPYSEISMLKRGEKVLPIDGGPDILRAVYGFPLDEEGHLSNRAGDSYILFADWLADGRFIARSAHNFGSATLDKTSPHYSDQMDMFVAMEERLVPMTLAAVMAEKTRDYSP